MSDTRVHPNVIHIDEVDGFSREKGRFSFATKRLGVATAAAGVGCSWYEVEPGNTAFPRHYHCATEEAIYVLEGTGSLRMGDAEVDLRAGHYATFPVGPEHAHQLIATGDGPLRYLCLSTIHSTDVVGYPDAGKIGVMATRGTDWNDPIIAKFFPGDADVGYFDGEDTGE